MPDEEREIIFPQGVPVHLIRDGRQVTNRPCKNWQIAPPLTPNLPLPTPRAGLVAKPQKSKMKLSNRVESRERTCWNPDNKLA